MTFHDQVIFIHSKEMLQIAPPSPPTSAGATGAWCDLSPCEFLADRTEKFNQCMSDESIVRNTQLDISDMTVELNTIQLDTIDNWYHFPHRSHDRNQINQGLWELGLWAASAASPLLPAVVLTGLTWENSVAHQGDNFNVDLWFINAP